MVFFVEGKPFDPQHAIHNAVSNIICSIVFGDRFDYDNKRFAYLLEIVKENIIQSGHLLDRYEHVNICLLTIIPVSNWIRRSIMFTSPFPQIVDTLS